MNRYLTNKLQLFFLSCLFCSPLLTKVSDKKAQKACKTIPSNKAKNNIRTLAITNPTDQPIVLQIDLRVDYYYQHKKKKTFLPASKINKRITVQPQTTEQIAIPLPNGLHEPYNSIKRKLLTKKYEHTDTTIRGVIMVADNPKKFQRIKTTLIDKQTVCITL